MKTLTIYKREYKKVGQFVIYYGGVEFMRNFKEHVDINDKNLKVKFNKMYESRSFVKFNLLLNDVFKKRTSEFYHNLYFSLKLFDKICTNKYLRESRAAAVMSTGTLRLFSLE